MSNYERIARAITFLDKNFADQPNLAVVAGQVGLSPYHFHRLFSSWAGVTPKDFLQCLTLNHAKELLRRGESVLGAALESGLSGPGRLHDLCVQLEAASPGEMKTGGAGLAISFGAASTPFGTWLVGRSGRGISHVSFVEMDLAETGMRTLLAQEWPGAALHRDDSVASDLAATVFSSTPAAEQQPLRAHVQGTEFQIRVWRALLQVPPGSLISYGRLAELSGASGAARAVGAAVGDNPLAYLIPCHRVIRNTGIVGQYRWGTVRKRIMIARESLTHPQADTFQ